MQTMGPRGRGSIAQFERSIADQCIGEKKRTIRVHTRQERRARAQMPRARFVT